MSVEIGSGNIVRLRNQLECFRDSHRSLIHQLTEKELLVSALQNDREKFEWLMERTGWNRYKIWQEMIKEEKQ